MRRILAVIGVVAISAVIGIGATIDRVDQMPHNSFPGWQWHQVHRDSTVIATADMSDTLAVYTVPRNFTGRLLGVQIVPGRDITGAATNHRRLIVAVSDSTGTVTKVDSVSFASGTDAPKLIPYSIYNPSLGSPTTVGPWGSVLIIDQAVGANMALPNYLVQTLISVY